MSSRIVYLINQYPKVSHSFIRREILEMERQGFEILRIAIQGWDAELADEEDRQERTRTRYVLQDGFIPLLLAATRVLFLLPVQFFSALMLAARMARNAERSFPYHLIYLAEACRIRGWLEAFGASHVHAHFGSNSAEVAMLVNALGGPPYSFTVHGQDELYFGGIGEKVRRAKFVVAISSFGRSQLMRLVDHSLWSRIIVVHCGLEKRFYDVVPTLPPMVPRLICVGRFSAEKAQLLLVEAARRLAQKGISFELVLAGDGEMRGEVEDLIGQYGLSGQVRITGWISGKLVREEIMAARALVLPSFSEGLPVVIMEAMALRRPVLASCIAGIPELVMAGETGWLFPAGSVEELALAMADCLQKTPEELKKMGDSGYLRVMERHSIEIEATKLAECIRAGEFREV